MCLRAPMSLFLACTLALMPFFAVSWDLKKSDFEDNIDESNSNGLQCPSCFVLRGTICKPILKWCTKDQIKCLSFSGNIIANATNTDIEIKACVNEALCNESITSFRGFNISTKHMECTPAKSGAAKIQTKSLIFFIFFLEKLLY